MNSTSSSLIRRGRPPAHRGPGAARPLALNACTTPRTVSSSAATSRAIAGTGVPGADAIMIIARRTRTDPCLSRGTICRRRRPSSSRSRRARTGSAIAPLATRSTPHDRVSGTTSPASTPPGMSPDPVNVCGRRTSQCAHRSAVTACTLTPTDTTTRDRAAKVVGSAARRLRARRADFMVGDRLTPIDQFCCGRGLVPARRPCLPGGVWPPRRSGETAEQARLGLAGSARLAATGRAGDRRRWVRSPRRRRPGARARCWGPGWRGEPGGRRRRRRPRQRGAKRTVATRRRPGRDTLADMATARPVTAAASKPTAL